MSDGRDTPRWHWVVQGADVSSGALARHIHGDPALRLVRQIAPDVMVIAMTVERAERLEKEFAELIIESDAGLDPYAR